MQIDWLTVAAQIVNFLVLLWLLQHFLYGPIIRAMDRREQRIADRLKDAKKRKEQAEKEAQEFRNKQADVKARREEILADAREAADQERKSLEESARKEIERKKQEWLEQLDEEQNAFAQDLRQRSLDAFYALARRAFGDLANAELESQIVSVFIDRIRNIDPEVRRKLRRQCKEGEEAVNVSTRFALSPKDKGRITKAIHDEIHDEISVQYEERTDALSGIEMKVGSQSVSWGLDSFLDDLVGDLAQQVGKATSGRKEQNAP